MEIKTPYLTLEECYKKYSNRLTTAEIESIFQSGQNIEKAKYSNDIMSIMNDKTLSEKTRRKKRTLI